MDSEPSTPAESSRSGKRNRGLLSCTECHRRKQKCNREQPCNDCTQRNVPQKCRYQIPIRANQGQYFERGGAKNARLRRIITGSEVILTPESVAALQGDDSAGPLPYHFADPITDVAITRGTPLLHPSSVRPVLTEDLSLGGDPWLLGGSDPFSIIPETDGDPIPKKYLICYFLQRLAPWLSNYDDTLTPSSPRVSWLPFAMNHKVLFMATMLSAVVHLDRIQPIEDPRKLLWYKVETMRLANETMKVPSEGATDQMVLVALILLYFNVGGGNSEEYEIHLKGIHQMLKFRGGVQTLGMRGMVKNWLDICYGPWNDEWQDGEFSADTSTLSAQWRNTLLDRPITVVAS